MPSQELYASLAGYMADMDEATLAGELKFCQKELQDDDARADALIAYTKSVPVRSHLHRLRAMPDCHPTPLPLPRSS